MAAKPKTTKNDRVTIRLHRDTYRRLRRLARERHRPVAEFVRRILERYVA